MFNECGSSWVKQRNTMSINKMYQHLTLLILYTHTIIIICIQHIICKYTGQMLAAWWGAPEVYCHVVVKSTVPVD